MKSVSTKLSLELWEKVHARCKAQGLTVSEFSRQAIQESLQRLDDAPAQLKQLKEMEDAMADKTHAVTQLSGELNKSQTEAREAKGELKAVALLIGGRLGDEEMLALSNLCGTYFAKRMVEIARDKIEGVLG